jgi:hypothetical protein
MQSSPLAVLPSLAMVRIAAIVVSLGLWFWTQRLLAKRNPSGASFTAGGAICDGIHNLTAPIHKHLLENPRHANALLASSSFVIDLFGFYLLASAILGFSFQPFLGLLMLFALRQFCQMLCPLRCPDGMIWRSPAIPTILVTYGTCNDLFVLRAYRHCCLRRRHVGRPLGPAWDHARSGNHHVRSRDRLGPPRPLHNGRLHRSHHRTVCLSTVCGMGAGG